MTKSSEFINFSIHQIYKVRRLAVLSKAFAARPNCSFASRIVWLVSVSVISLEPLIIFLAFSRAILCSERGSTDFWVVGQFEISFYLLPKTVLSRILFYERLVLYSTAFAMRVGVKNKPFTLTQQIHNIRNFQTDPLPIFEALWQVRLSLWDLLTLAFI